MGKKEIENYIDRVKFGRSYRKYAKDLAKFGDGLVSDLTNLLKESEEDVRKTAVEVLGNVGPEAKEAVPDLVEAANDKYIAVREAAVRVLGKIGPDAVAAVSALIKVLQDDVDVDVRSSAAVALGNIGHQRAVLALIKALEPDEYVRYFASEASGRIGEPAVPNLIVALKHTHHDVRRAAASSLGDVGPDAEAAVPALIEATNKDTDADVRHAADWALMNIRRKE
jgi:HEAT repeat protein